MDLYWFILENIFNKWNIQVILMWQLSFLRKTFEDALVIWGPKTKDENDFKSMWKYSEDIWQLCWQHCTAFPLSAITDHVS
jgi:hypothetical protein